MRSKRIRGKLELFSGFLLALVLFSSCGNVSTNYETDPKTQLRNHIELACSELKNCEIDLAKAFAFSWDKLYVFNLRVERDTIGRVIGKEYPMLSDEYSTKWIFDDGGNLRFKEYPIGRIDRPNVVGDIDFDFGEANRDYILFSRKSRLSVEVIEVEGGNFYRLRCRNCESD